MRDQRKTKAELIRDLHALRSRIAELERARGELALTGRRPTKKDDAGRAEAASTKTPRSDEHAPEDVLPGLDWPQLSRSLIDNAHDVITVVDRDGIVMLINHTFSGITPEQVIGTTVYEYVSAEHHQTVSAALRSVFETGRAEVYEVAGTGPDGTTSWYRNRVGPIKHDGRVVAASIIAADITAQRDAEQQLGRTRQRLQYILNTAPVTTYTCKVGGDWAATFMSDNVKEQFGYEPRQFIEDPEFWSANIHPDDRERVLIGLQRLSENGFHAHEYRFAHKDGSYRCVHDEVRLVRDDKRDALECIGYWVDITQAKTAEEELRRSEEQFKGIFENTAVGMYRTTPDGRILMANPAVVRMLGYESFDELAERNLEQIGYEPQYPRSAFKERVEADGEVVGLESAWTRQDGTTLHIIENARAIRDEQGSTLYYEGTAEDITERKKMEGALKIKDNAIASSINAVAISDMEGRLTYVNSSFLRMWGYANAEEVIGRRAVEFWQIEDEVVEVIDLLREKGSWIGELSALRKDGSTFEVQLSASVVTDEHGAQVCMMGSFVDITERKQTEAALRENEERYRTLVENLPQRVFLKDRNSTYVSCNENFARDVGISPELLPGKTDYDFFAPELAEKYRADDKRIMESGEIQDIEERAVLQGREMLVHTVKAPVRDKEDNVTGVLGIF